MAQGHLVAELGLSDCRAHTPVPASPPHESLAAPSQGANSAAAWQAIYSAQPWDPDAHSHRV